jgi:hypothetical protein
MGHSGLEPQVWWSCLQQLAVLCSGSRMYVEDRQPQDLQLLL